MLSCKFSNKITCMVIASFKPFSWSLCAPFVYVFLRLWLLCIITNSSSNYCCSFFSVGGDYISKLFIVLRTVINVIFLFGFGNQGKCSLAKIKMTNNESEVSGKKLATAISYICFDYLKLTNKHTYKFLK